MTALDDKINDRFPGLVVRKDSREGRQGQRHRALFRARISVGPQYCATNDETSI